MNSILSNKQNISYNIISVDILTFEIQGIGWDLSMMKSYKMTKRTTKIKKIEKSLRMYNIKKIMTIRYKLTASGTIIHSITNYKLMMPVSILRLHKEKKHAKDKSFTDETQYLNLKASSNNVKMQSDRTLTTQIYLLLTIQQVEIFLNETR